MRRKKRITIAIESESILVIRGLSKTAQAWCEKCAVYTYSAPLSEVSRLPWLDAEVLEQFLESEQLHLVKTPDGALQICLRSMMNLHLPIGI